MPLAHVKDSGVPLSVSRHPGGVPTTLPGVPSDLPLRSGRWAMFGAAPPREASLLPAPLQAHVQERGHGPEGEKRHGCPDHDGQYR